MAHHAHGPSTLDTKIRKTKQLLGEMRGAKIKALRKDDVFPLVKINSVIQQAHAKWSQLDTEMMVVTQLFSEQTFPKL